MIPRNVRSIVIIVALVAVGFFLLLAFYGSSDVRLFTAAWLLPLLILVMVAVVLLYSRYRS